MATNRSTQRACDLKRVHFLYDIEEPYGPDVCVYCGDPATTRDHVPPISHAVTLLDLPAASRPACRLMPACRDCNVRLNGYASTSLAERRAELRRRLRRRWRRLLNGYDWQAEETAALGYSLRTAIEGMEHRRLAVLERLAFPRKGEAILRRTIAAMNRPAPKDFHDDAPPGAASGPSVAVPPQIRPAHAPLPPRGSFPGSGGWVTSISTVSLRALKPAPPPRPSGPDWPLLAETWGARQLSFLPVLDSIPELLG